jgi:hypothetical protein
MRTSSLKSGSVLGVARKKLATKRRSSGLVLHDNQKSHAAEQGN